MATTSANYVFLPWVRDGIASRIATPDSLGEAQAGAVSLPITLRLDTGDQVSQTVRLLGPGDVTGIDRQQIVRREPRDHATDFEPNYFPAIEFDRPDFPWLFTPAKAIADGKLRPWLCLVVVQQHEGVTLRREGRLPVLEIRNPDVELPDLDESWAWAHTQVTGATRNAAALAQALAGDPALTVSRLLCARRLDPLTSYFACLVPTFELGRKAGLGDPITPSDEAALEPAWKRGPGRVVLPVYDHWEFRTGQGGDFESLVRQLQPRKLPDEAGTLLVEIGNPNLGVAPATLEMPTALCVSKPTMEPQLSFASAIAPLLDAPAHAVSTGTADPLLAPPIYGAWHAARRLVDFTPATQTWLDDLNLDPRHRAAAALGTQVVQTQQEPLMAAAWEQLGDIRRINQLRLQAQLAREINGVYHAKHFQRLSTESLLKIAAPAQSRLVIQTVAPNTPPTRMLLSQRIAKSSLAVTAVSAPLRRMSSERSIMSARFVPRSITRAPFQVLARLIATATAPASASGPVTINTVSDHGPQMVRQHVRFERLAPALASGPRLGRFKVGAEGDGTVLAAVFPVLAGTPPTGMPDNADAQAFRSAAQAHMQYLTGLAPSIAPALPVLDLFATRAAVLTSLDPTVTITARVHASIAMAGATPPQNDPLQPILEEPVFPQPMYEALRDLSQKFLFPGIDAIPINTVTVLETNPSFIEAFLVGLNTEMSRELLWRGYPTDQRGTPFRQFWQSLGGVQPDIDAITEWGTNRLGDSMHAGDELVLLVRGELLRRYPGSVIYAVAAVPRGDQLDLSTDPNDELHPLFRGTLQPDITFLGFKLKKAEALANPGWFFVIQEQPTEPRFGLDVADYSMQLPAPSRWNELSWRHFADTPERLAALSHAPARTSLPTIDRVTWGRNGGHQAFITMQRRVRIAMHAKDMIAT